MRNVRVLFHSSCAQVVGGMCTSCALSSMVMNMPVKPIKPVWVNHIFVRSLYKFRTQSIHYGVHTFTSVRDHLYTLCTGLTKTTTYI